METVVERIRRLGRESAIPSTPESVQPDSREQAIIDRHTSAAPNISFLQKAAKGMAAREIGVRREQRAVAEQASPEIVGIAQEMLKSTADRKSMLETLRKMTPEQKAEVLRIAPGIAQKLGDDRGGIASRTLDSVSRGVAGVSQPISELIGTGGTPEEIEYIRQLEAASQEFAPARPDDAWYQRGPLQAAEMAPWMATVVTGAGIGRSALTQAAKPLAARMATKAGMGKATLAAAGKVGELAGTTAAAFPSMYAQEVDQLKAIGMQEGTSLRLLAAGTAVVGGLIEGIVPNPFGAGKVPLTEGAIKAARQYLWEAAKKAPAEMSEEYLQGVTSGLGKHVAQYLDKNAEEKTISQAFETGWEQAKEAALPMAFLLGVPAAAGAGVSAAQAQRLTRLQEIVGKGFVSAEDAAKEGIQGKNRKERMANAEAEVKQLSEQTTEEKRATVAKTPTFGGDGQLADAQQQTQPPLQVSQQPQPLPPSTPPADPATQAATAQPGAEPAAGQSTSQQPAETTGPTPSPQAPVSSFDEYANEWSLDLAKRLNKPVTTITDDARKSLATAIENSADQAIKQGRLTKFASDNAKLDELQLREVQNAVRRKGYEPTEITRSTDGGVDYVGFDVSKKEAKPNTAPVSAAQSSQPIGDVVQGTDGKLYRENPNAKTPAERIKTRQLIDPSEGIVLVTKDQFDKPIPHETLKARQEFADNAKPGSEFEHKNFRGQSFKVLDDGTILNSSGRKMNNVQAMANTVQPGQITWKGTPSTAGASEETGNKPTTAPPVASPDAPAATETSMGETGGKKQPSEARADDVQSLSKMLAEVDAQIASQGRVVDDRLLSKKRNLEKLLDTAKQDRDNKLRERLKTLDYDNLRKLNKDAVIQVGDEIISDIGGLALEELNRRMDEAEKQPPADAAQPSDTRATPTGATGDRATPAAEQTPKSEGLTEGFRSLPANGRAAFETEWQKGGTSIKNLLYPDNKNYRAEFEARTGIKLPNRVGLTFQAVEDWHEAGRPLAPNTAAGSTTKQPESKWQAEARSKLEAVPAFKGATIEPDEKAGTVRVTRQDGLATTIHLDADEKLASAAEKLGRKQLYGLYFRKNGETEGRIYIHSKANHSNILNHEVMHWLEDQGVVTKEEVEQHGGQEAIAEKYGKWASIKHRKKDSVFQRIYDALEPLFSSQARFFEQVGQRQAAKPQENLSEDKKPSGIQPPAGYKPLKEFTPVVTQILSPDLQAREDLDAMKQLKLMPGDAVGFRVYPNPKSTKGGYWQYGTVKSAVMGSYATIELADGSRKNVSGSWLKRLEPVESQQKPKSGRGGGAIMAVMTSDGVIHSDPEAVTHFDVVEKFGLDSSDIIDGGFIIDGKYKMAQSDGGYAATEGDSEQVATVKRYADEYNAKTGSSEAKSSAPQAQPEGSDADLEAMIEAEFDAQLGTNKKPTGKKSVGKSQADTSKYGNTLIGRQFAEAKAAGGEDTMLLFRMGDFYELYFEDAQKAAKMLGLTLVARDKSTENPIPMAGFPHHQIDGYLKKLKSAGIRVAVNEAPFPTKPTGKKQPANPKAEKKSGLRKAADNARKEADDLWADLNKMSKDKLTTGLDPELAKLAVRVALAEIKADTLTFAAFVEQAVSKIPADMLDKLKPYMEVAWKVAHKRGMTNDPGGKFDDVLAKGKSDETRTGTDANERVEDGTRQPDGNAPAASDRTDGIGEAENDTGQPSNQLLSDSRSAKGYKRGRGRKGNGTDGRADASESEPGPRDTADSGTRGDDGAVDERLAVDHVIEQDDDLAVSSLTTSLARNINALEILKSLETDGRFPNEGERKALAQYTGWGGLSQALDSIKGERMLGDKDWLRDPNWEKQWGKAYLKLKQLLTKEEMQAAQDSTENAHYTSKPVIQSLWKIAERLGYQGGRVLELGAGIGHFAGLMPSKVRGSTKFIMVEMDSVSSRIAKMLYPNHEVFATDMAEFKAVPGSVTMGIGNVPFAGGSIADAERRYGVELNLHNYAFARHLDAVAPGGIVVAISTHKTLDANIKQRQFLATKGDLIGAIRLPNDAFAENAKTEVVTDILIFRRPRQGEPKVGVRIDQNADVTVKTKDGRDVVRSINKYFIDNPHMVLGTHSANGSMYGPDEYTLESTPGDLQAKINAAIESLPLNMLGQVEVAEQVVSTDKSVPFGRLEIHDGKVVMGYGDKFVELNGQRFEGFPVHLTGKTGISRAKDYIELRDQLARVRNIMLDEAASDDDVKQEQKKLGKAYDRYVEKHGPLNAPKTNVFVRDPDYYRVMALENERSEYNPDTKKIEVTYGKAAIFTERVLGPQKEPESAASPADAMSLSIAWRGAINADFIGKLLGVTAKEAEAKLLDEGLAFRNPTTTELELADLYLSGNVRTKLAQAEISASEDPQYQKNVDALKKVLPEPVTLKKDTVRLGAAWIPENVINAFASQAFGTEVSVTYNANTDAWTVGPVSSVSDAAKAKYKTGRVDPEEILAEVLNLRSIKVYDRVETGEYTHAGKPKTTQVLNEKETQAAKHRASVMRADFDKWVMESPDVSRLLAKLYNEKYNNFVRTKYNGDFLVLPGANPEVKLRPYQKNAIWRILNRGTSLLAHAVGSGKTYTMIGAAMEMRRLGLARRPVLVVQNATLGQFATSFQKMYPNANILVANKDDLGKGKRQLFLNKISTGNWDAVVMAQSTFDNMASDPAVERAFIQDQLDLLEEAIREEGGENAKTPTVKQLVRTKKSLKKRFGKLIGSRSKKQDNVTFEDLGADALFLDEAHAYKKPMFTTKLTQLVGLNTEASARSIATTIKVRSIQTAHNGRNVILATGTPVTNTLGEAWHMVNYVSPATNASFSSRTFDQFVGNFAQVEPTLTMNAGGKYVYKDAIVKFRNGHQLVEYINDSWDIVTPDQLRAYMESTSKGFPKLRNGQPTAITVNRTPGVANFMDFIERVYDRFNALPAKERRAMSFIPALAYGASKAATLDIRLVNPNAAEEKDSKLQKAADEIKRIYDESMDTKGTQLFFSDMKNQFSMTRLHQFMGGETIDAFEEDSGDTANADSESGEETEAVEVDDNESESFLYQELRKKLLAQGIPAEQIAFVADAKTDQQRQTLFERVNNGDIRVLIGSTAKMGVGVNVQKKLVALHHFDTPWLPADLEQREGRILRFGNENDTVDIIRYAMKKTLDGAIYMATARKQKFIWQVLNGQLDGDSFEDPSSAAMLSIEEQLAAIQDDPIFFEKIEVQNRLRELELERQSFYDAQQRLADSLANTKSNLNYLESRSLPKWKDRADRIQKLQDDGELSKFSLSHGKQTFTDPKQAAEYIKAKVEEVRAYILKNWDSARTFYQVYGGLLGMPAKQKVQFTVGPAGVVIAAQPAFVTETNAEGKEVTKSSVKFKSVAYLQEPDGVYEFYDGTATVPQTFFDKAQTILDETKQDISTGMRRVEEYTAKIGELEKLLENQWEDQDEYEQKKARLAAIEKQMLSSEGSLASGKKKSKDKTPKTITKRGQYVLPGMPGMVEDIDRQDFVRKYLDRALEPLWGWSSNPDDAIEIQEAIDTMSPHVAALMNEIYAGKFIDSYAARKSQAYVTAITAAARTDMDELITDSLDKAIDQAVAESPEQPEDNGDEDSQNISVDVLRTRGSGTPQQASQSPFSATEGETKEGKRLLNQMKRDSLKRKIGPRSIMNFLKDVVRVASIEGKSQLSRRNPGHYKPREHLVRSRTGASGVIDTHEAGHALSALLRDKDKRILARHEASLIALTQMPNSMASGQTAEEGIAEFVRRYIVDYQSLPKALVADLEADIAKVSPELLAGLKDTNRLWQQFLARPLQERLDASKNDRARRSGRGFRDAVYRSLYNLIGGDVAIHKVRRELERPLFQFSQEMGRKFREMATDTQADIDNAYQSVIRVPVETQRAIFGDSRSDKHGVSIIAFGDNMFSEDTIGYLRDGGFSVPDEFKHGERVYLTNQSFEQIRQKLGDDWDAFENYGQLRASLERAERKGQQSAWMHESVSMQEAAAAIDAMEKEHPTWIDHFDEVREFFDSLLLVATLSGEYTPEEAVRIRNAWDSYWPLLRQVTPEESGRVGRAGPDPSAGIYRAFGSALPLRNLLEAVELRTKAAMQAYYTNRMMLAIRKYSDTLHAMKEAPFDIRKAGARLMVPLKMDLQKVASLSPMEQAQMILDYMNKQLQEEAEANGEDFEPLTLEDIDISMPWKPIFRAKRPGAIQVIGLTENGDRKYYQVTDPLLFDLMSNSGSMSRYATWLARFFAKGIGPWKRALTQNLAFAVRNLPRDTVTALTMGESGKSFVPGVFLAYGIVGRLNGSLGQDAPARAELFSRSLESLHRPRHKKVWDSFVEATTEGIVIPGYWDMNFYDRVSESPGQLSAVALWPVTMFNWATGGRYVAQMSEELQREGAFLEARGRGKSYEYAQRQYDQISGNFSQKQPNHATATFIRSAGFLNPGLQIMWGQMKRWHDPDPRSQKLYLAKLPGLAAWFSVASAINVALVYALFGDDEEKLDEVLNDMRERPDYEKDTTMSVMGTVRLPFEYGLSGAVASFAWNATQDSLLGGSNETIPTRLKAFLARATQIPGPTDAIHPYLKTAIELQMGEAGYSMYRNDAIVDANLIVQYPVNPELRAYNNTPELFKQIGERLKVSPLKVEYAVGSLFTGTAQDLLSLASKVGSGDSIKAEDVPVMSRLVQRESTGFRSQAVRELQKASQEVEALATKIKKMGDAAPSKLRDQYAKLHEAALAYDIVSDMYDTVKNEVDADQTNHDVVEKTERKMTHFARQFLDYRAGKDQPPEQLKTRKHEYYGLQAYHATGNPESETGRKIQAKGRAMIELSGMTLVESKKALIDYWQKPDKSGKKNPTHESKQGSYVMKPELKERLDKLKQLFSSP